MHPAYSVIVFTVLSGAGFGLLAMVGLAPALGLALAPSAMLGGLGLGGALAVAGLLSSTRHLGHPERAWRALTQWRTSWLSREGVLAIATLGCAALYALAILRGGPLVLPGALLAALCAATIYATAMIYACLRTVTRWRQPLTPWVYLSAGGAGGVLLLALVAAVSGPAQGAGLATAAVVALVLSGAIKRAWWRAGDTARPLSTPESATGLGHLGAVRMLEAPHTSANYLITEMGFVVARRRAAALRRLTLRLGVAAAALSALAAAGAAPVAALTLAALAYFAAALVSRWLFFAEATHAVTTFYDRRAPTPVAV